jgi:hypothetical protein
MVRQESGKTVVLPFSDDDLRSFDLRSLKQIWDERDFWSRLGEDRKSVFKDRF